MSSAAAPDRAADVWNCQERSLSRERSARSWKSAAAVLGIMMGMAMGGSSPSATAAATAVVPDRHVVVVVFDGMRPDFITPQYTPNLYSLATNGVFFRRHHPVFVSTTIVNGTALATGSHPGTSGVLANADFRPELDSQTAVASDSLNAIRRYDLLTGGKYIQVDTLAELIQDAGYHTYVAGTKGVALVHDRLPRKVDSAAHSNSVTLFRGLTLPRAGLDPLKNVNDDKEFPNNFTTPNLASDSWTTRALIRGLWKRGVPRYSLLWLSDPDVTQHAKGVGSAGALEGIEASDRHLGDVLKALRDKGLTEKTDVMVVSDHGFSTIERSADLADALRKRGLNAHSKFDNPETGDVIVTGLGGAAMIHVLGGDPGLIRRCAEVLQTCDFTGVIFSRLEIEGTFPLEAVHYGREKNGPDLVVSLRWRPEVNDEGAPGWVVSTGGSRNAGTHGSLSRYDMNNILVASGPSFRRGMISDLPSGNIDVAPTVLHLLGIQSPSRMNGRVLVEALVHPPGPVPQARQRRIEASRRLGFMQWRQYLVVSEVGSATYFDEGNGTLTFGP